MKTAASLMGALLLASLIAPNHASRQQAEFRRPDVALEIGLPDKSHRRVRFTGGGMKLIWRQSLKIVDPNAAGDFTAIDVWTKAEGQAITVRLSIIYNDLSNQEWWKDKKEKVVGSYVIHSGESARAGELAAFGIEPFEMRVIEASSVELKLGEGPRIVNNTMALEVVRLEKQLDRCAISIRNN